MVRMKQVAPMELCVMDVILILQTGRSYGAMCDECYFSSTNRSLLWSYV